MHAVAAASLKIPELEIDNKEAEQLAKAIGDVSAHYGFELSPKTKAWIELVWCSGVIYGTRIVAYNMRVKKEAQDRKGKVVDFPSQQ